LFWVMDDLNYRWVTAQAALSTGTPSHLASYPPYAVISSKVK
jgi:hypothetical protein